MKQKRACLGKVWHCRQTEGLEYVEEAPHNLQSLTSSALVYDLQASITTAQDVVAIS